MARTPRVPPELKHGPFSLAEARAAGISLSALRGRSWQRVGARLYRWKGGRHDALRLIEACRRTLPASAVFVGRTAAWLHGLDVEPANPLQVAVANLESRAGLEIRHLDVRGETMEVKRIRVTSLPRTLLDLCVWSSEVEALVAIDMAVRLRLTHEDELLGYATGRAGAARLRRLAAIAAPAESPMETRLRWLLLEAGLPRPQVQAALYGDTGEFLGRADLYFPHEHLAVEFDGGNHRDRLTGDDRRQNSILAAGYRMLRFTSADVHGRPNDVIALVRAALEKE